MPASILVLAVAAAFAGDAAKPGMAPEAMQGMMKEMMGCTVCKHMAPHMASLGPVLKMDVANLNDGAAFLHTVSDPAKLAEFRAVNKEMETAGQGCATMTDEQTKTQLCSFCQGIHAAMKAGAKMSSGEIKNGNIMVLTSSDPAVQKSITALAQKCAMMASMM